MGMSAKSSRDIAREFWNHAFLPQTHARISSGSTSTRVRSFWTSSGRWTTPGRMSRRGTSTRVSRRMPRMCVLSFSSQPQHREASIAGHHLRAASAVGRGCWSGPHRGQRWGQRWGQRLVGAPALGWQGQHGVMKTDLVITRVRIAATMGNEGHGGQPGVRDQPAHPSGIVPPIGVRRG